MLLNPGSENWQVSVQNISWITRAEATQFCLPYSHGDTSEWWYTDFIFVVFCFKMENIC